MRAVIQRVSEASVQIGNQTISSIGYGLLVLLGIEEADDTEDIDWLAGKIARLRVFPDDEGVMNLSVTDLKGDILVVSQFTLHASTKKGNRPSYIRSAPPLVSVPMYENFLIAIEEHTGKKPQCGEFGAMMEVSLINSGPVTIGSGLKN
jgi:D-aminoacyl-tRNA deacylase